MYLHNTIIEPVDHLPQLNHRPEFQDPWRLSHTKYGSYWWRIDTGGTIYKLDLETGKTSSF